VYSFLFLVGAAILVYQICFWVMRTRDLVDTIRRVPEIFPDKQVPMPGEPPLISVIVPAHNEETGIRECLESVLSQDYPRVEVILVDDRSTDRTMEVARLVRNGGGNLRIVSVKQRRHGWTGKCHALHEGVKRANGEWLAFLDADSRLHPTALRQCFGLAVSARVSMLTLTPQFILKDFWERAIQPAMASMSLILFPLGKVNDPASKVASANGMFYLITRKAYERIGGHRDVKSLAVEDIGIGKRVKAAGLGLMFANGRRVMQTRMYNGFRETLEGWTRILSASLNYDLGAAAKYLGMHVLMCFPTTVLALCLYMSTAQAILPGTWFLLPSVAALVMCVVPTLYFARLGMAKKYAALLVLGQLMLIWVFVIIVRKIRRKDALQWRGTTYGSTRYEPARLDPAA
jgi:glycosyltransferase involved in cell wall biosynthesis